MHSASTQMLWKKIKNGMRTVTAVCPSTVSVFGIGGAEPSCFSL